MTINKKKYLTKDELNALTKQFNSQLQNETDFMADLEFKPDFNFIVTLDEKRWNLDDERLIKVDNNFSDERYLLAVANAPKYYVVDYDTKKYIPKTWFNDTFRQADFIPLIKEMEQNYKAHNFSIIKSYETKAVRVPATFVRYDDRYYILDMSNLINLHWDTLYIKKGFKIDPETLNVLNEHKFYIEMLYNSDTNKTYYDIAISPNLTLEQQNLIQRMNKLINNYNKDTINHDNLDFLDWTSYPNAYWHSLLDTDGNIVFSDYNKNRSSIILTNDTIKVHDNITTASAWLDNILDKNLSDNELLAELKTSYKNSTKQQSKISL